MGNLKISGSIRVNGVDIKENISKVSAYIQQRDDFVGVLKVEEHLEFYSRLKLSKMTNNQRKQKIDEVVSLMGLKKCLKTEIGVPGLTKTISGGEMKRLGYFNFVKTNFNFNSHAGGMAVARSYGFGIDFVRNPISGSVS